MRAKRFDFHEARHGVVGARGRGDRGRSIDGFIAPSVSGEVGGLIDFPVLHPIDELGHLLRKFLVVDAEWRRRERVVADWFPRLSDISGGVVVGLEGGDRFSGGGGYVLRSIPLKKKIVRKLVERVSDVGGNVKTKFFGVGGVRSSKTIMKIRTKNNKIDVSLADVFVQFLEAVEEGEGALVKRNFGSEANIENRLGLSWPREPSSGDEVVGVGQDLSEHRYAGFVKGLLIEGFLDKALKRFEVGDGEKIKMKIRRSSRGFIKNAIFSKGFLGRHIPRKPIKIGGPMEDEGLQDQ
jgi:hypothetical protein